MTSFDLSLPDGIFSMAVGERESSCHSFFNERAIALILHYSYMCRHAKDSTIVPSNPSLMVTHEGLQVRREGRGREGH